MTRHLFVVLVASLLAACAPTRERVGAADAQWIASPNFNERRASFVILHHTGDDSAQGSLGTLTSALREVSAHYLIGRDGRVYQLVDERERAWHAGESFWGGNTDLNSASIGIELDNNGREPFPTEQIDALVRLLEDVTTRQRIPRANVLGHADVAPRRKVDPSRHFPWRLLATHGFGLWCDAPYPEPPRSFDAMLGLQALGYETEDPGATVEAFKRRFLPDEIDRTLNERDRALIHCLLQRRGESPR